MTLRWADEALEDYRWWLKHDARLHRRVNKLIDAIEKEPFRGIGKPEPLRHEWSGYWSRRINEEHRLIYKVEKGVIFIAACRYHYGK
ncbi:MAG: toxin YoeB [Candidatus Muproteobacteria bacterium RIFCSPHIGHO2_12_FULL_60_33]|nr:MAG: toxin YoeB [Candidatus Muproteobacteria bacterium RIFCSPHIGHO2_12_FULL_60_33]